MSTVPSVGSVIWQAVRHAPPRTRGQLQAIAYTWTATMVIQFWDIRGRHGPRVWAEMASVVLVTAGILLVGLMRALGDASVERVHDVERGRHDKRMAGPVLLALPVMALVAAALIAAAVTILVVRFFLGHSFMVLALAAVNLGALVILIRSTSAATRVLYGRALEQEAIAARAESEAAHARLAALQAQMNPHFLFNALNTVASLVRTDPRAAETTVENLSDVLRRTLERTSATTATLADEVDYVKAYLAVEQQRFGDRLRVEWAVAPDLLDVTVPPLTLQPLVENAIRHGIAPRRAGGRVRVIATAAPDRVRLIVEDDGEGFAARPQEGTGLGNLRKRLDVLYGARAFLRLESSPAGARVVVEIPRHARADR